MFAGLGKIAPTVEIVAKRQKGIKQMLNNTNNSGLDFNQIERELSLVNERELFLSFERATESGPGARVGLNPDMFLRTYEIARANPGDSGEKTLTWIDLEGEGSLLGRHFVQARVSDSGFKEISRMLREQMGSRLGD